MNIMDISHVRRVRQLYKVILKMHNGLPEAIKSIGNTYVRDEFRRHKSCTPKEGAIFLDEWTVIQGEILIYEKLKCLLKYKVTNMKDQSKVLVESLQWKYAVVLAQQIGLKGPKSAQPLGKPLTLDQLDSMSDDQIQQLYQLMLAAQGKRDEDFFEKQEMKQNIGD